MKSWMMGRMSPYVQWEALEHRLGKLIMYSGESYSSKSIEIMLRGLTLYSSGFYPIGAHRILLKAFSGRSCYKVWWLSLQKTRGCPCICDKS